MNKMTETRMAVYIHTQYLTNKNKKNKCINKTYLNLENH